MMRCVLAALISVVPVASALAQSNVPAKPRPLRLEMPGPAKTGSETPRAAAPAGDCSEYGAGFKRAEGTGTCVKIGGYVRTQGSTR